MRDLELSDRRLQILPCVIGDTLGQLRPGQGRVLSMFAFVTQPNICSD